MTLEEFEKIKKAKIKELRSTTEEVILSKMPTWKQIRYKDFREMHEKILEGKSLTKYESTYYISMANNKETPEQHYKKVIAALNWIGSIINIHNLFEMSVLESTFVEDFQDKYPIYPKWPFED